MIVPLLGSLRAHTWIFVLVATLGSVAYTGLKAWRALRLKARAASQDPTVFSRRWITVSNSAAQIRTVSQHVVNPEFALRFVVGLLDRLPESLRVENTSNPGPAS